MMRRIPTLRLFADKSMFNLFLDRNLQSAATIISRERLKTDPDQLSKRFEESYSKFVNIQKSTFEANELQKYGSWLEELLRYNIPVGRQNWGFMVPATYVRLVPEEKFKIEDLETCFLLGWCTELLENAYLVEDDVMDGSETRRGKICWYKRNDVKLRAVNDSHMLSSSIFFTLEKICSDHPSYPYFVKLFSTVYRNTAIGMSIEMTENNHANYVNLNKFNIDTYSTITKWKTGYWMALPFLCGLHVAGFINSKLRIEVENILTKMAFCFNAENDFLDVFGEEQIGKMGDDIENGKLTWFILKALELCSVEQRKVLEEHYGRKSADSVVAVKCVYKQLKLDQLYLEFEDEFLRNISIFSERFL